MKRTFVRMRPLLALLLVFFSLGSAKAGEPVKRHNWENGMGQSQYDDMGMCVNLVADNMLFIKLHLNIAVNNINNLPPIHFRYVFKINNTVVYTGLTNAVTNNMLYPYANYYRATFSLPYDCSAICESNGVFSFGLEYQLVRPSMGTYMPYPVGSYPTAWPSNIFDLPTSIFDNWAYDSKTICCIKLQQITKPVGELAMEELNPESIHQYQRGGTLPYPSLQMPNVTNPASLTGQLLASPNPFQEAVAVKFNLSQPGKVVFNCIDAQGKVVKSFTELYQTVGQQENSLDMSEIPPGLYYLRMSTDSGVQVAKMVKSRN